MQSRAVQIANFANVLILIGSFIVVVTTEESIVKFAAYLKLFAGFLYVYAAYVETQEQQIAPGETTPLNKVKLGGTIISIIGAIILVYVLEGETYIKKYRPELVPKTGTPSIAPFIAPTAF